MQVCMCMSGCVRADIHGCVCTLCVHVYKIMRVCVCMCVCTLVCASPSKPQAPLVHVPEYCRASGAAKIDWTKASVCNIGSQSQGCPEDRRSPFPTIPPSSVAPL